MAITVEDLRDEVGAGADTHDVILQRSLDLATAMVAKYLADNVVTVGDEAGELPESVSDQAVLAVAVESFNQAQAPNGVLTQQFGLADGGSVASPVRIGADPMRPAYPLLSMWVDPVIA